MIQLIEHQVSNQMLRDSNSAPAAISHQMLSNFKNIYFAIRFSNLFSISEASNITTHSFKILFN